MAKYKDIRFWNNLEKAKYDGVGKYDIPVISPISYKGLEDIKWIGFNYASSCRNRGGKGVHFYLDDYQFDRVWFDISRYTSLLSSYDVVLTPDWSIYTDWPLAINIFNHYKKHYVGAYMQGLGIKVIPSINWGDKDSFDWCFDGEPVGGAVAVSSVGTQMEDVSRRGFIYGYDAMLEKLNPEVILFWGSIPNRLKGNIVKVDEFQSRFKPKVGDDKVEWTRGF